MKLLLLLPTLNEEGALKALANEIPDEFEVLVVDGYSTDGTKDVALEHSWRFVTQRYGRGKGCGIKTAMEEFLKTDCDCLGIIDADYTCDPKEMTRMLQALKDENFDVVLGGRDRVMQLHHLGEFSLFINCLTSGIVAYLYKQKLSDIQTGYWLFTREAVEKILPHLAASGFDIEYDMLYNAWRLGLKIGEMPVSIRKRTGKSKFSVCHRFKQVGYGLKYLGLSLRHLYGRRRF
ncbi:MAG: glycosyltransferase family 2 protein [Methanosarcinales archaeon]|nr:MAG: glycosyltransferase family 2 protein [Methanosarcinales archaeon]